MPTTDVVGIGLNATDTLLLVDEFPSYAGKTAFSEELISPGGQVATAMVACARLGLRAKYIGTIGDDNRGRIQQHSLEGTGVDTSSLIVRQGCPNQTAYIVIDKSCGERTVFWQRAACLELRPSEISAEDITGSRMLHLDGCDTEAAAWAAKLARDSGVPVSLDIDTVYPHLEHVLPNVDFLVSSSEWPSRWTGEPDLMRALQLLQQQYQLEAAIATVGQNGAVGLHRGKWVYSPGFPVKAVDTTGAGDVFHGAFCFAMLSSMPMRDALDFSNAAAALNCTAIGARGHIAAKPEVDALLASGQARCIASCFADLK